MLLGPRGQYARGGSAVFSLMAGLGLLSLAALPHCTLFSLDELDRGPTAATDDGGPEESRVPPGEAGASGSDGGFAQADGPRDSRVGPEANADDVGAMSDDGPAGDAGDGGRSSDADAAQEAGDADAGACVTTFADGSGRVLFAFATSDANGWAASVNSGGPTAVLGWSAAEGNTCPGSLTMDVGFHAYDGAAAGMVFAYGPGASWGAARRLHVWAKIEPRDDAGAIDFAALGALTLFVQSNGSTNYSFVNVAVNPTFSDGGWHEVLIDFTAESGQPGRSGPDVDPSSVQRFGLWLPSATSRPPGGPFVPPASRLLVDDVWLE